MGKGMDGHAGKDLIVKVPAARWSGDCRPRRSRDEAEDDDEDR